MSKRTQTYESLEASGQKLSVLFVSRKWPPAVGGMETYSIELCRELPKFVKLTTQVLPGRPDGSPPNALALMRFFANTALLLLKSGRTWDVVHFGDFVLFPLAWLHAKSAPRTKRIITVHGLDLIFGNRNTWKAALYRYFMRWAKGRHDCIDAIIANSRNTARLASEAGLGESDVIPLGVRLRQTDLIQPQPSSDPERFVLFVGRLVERKGAAWFASQVIPKLPSDVSFKVVGKTWSQAEENELQRAPRTLRLGYVSEEELDRLRANAVAVVMPNIPVPGDQDVEGFGIAALEATAGGAPLLAADLEGISDAVVDGVTGFLLPPLQPDRWAEKIHQLLGWTPQQRQAFLTSAKREIASNYSWHRVAQETVRVYQR